MYISELTPTHDTRKSFYGNLVSSNYKDYSAHLDEYAIQAMSENRYYIDSIDDDAELSALFDELETEQEDENDA